jgi:hypothetical protein
MSGVAGGMTEAEVCDTIRAPAPGAGSVRMIVRSG